MALTNKLSAIGDAIRAKTGGTELLTLDAMPTEIASIQTGGGELPEEAFTITGNCSYRFSNNGWNWFIDEFGDQIKAVDIDNANRMFYGSGELKEIPFDLNFDTKSTSHDIANIFSNCYKLKSISGEIKNCKPSVTQYLFSYCYNLRYLPKNLSEGFDWSYIEKQTSSTAGNRSSMFSKCYSLRSIPVDFLNHASPNNGTSYRYFYSGFSDCYVLDELVELPIPYTAALTGNSFNSTFGSCNRLKNITFAMPDGQPYVMNWKSQTIDLSGFVGYASTTGNITNYNSGLTFDTRVENDATYHALKNDPDWWTTHIAYSRYNHDSAVATINSLPDTSAYLATAGGTNTIKFKKDSGSDTDGGAISNLTQEEIAVATARGWTVTLA